MKYKLRGLREGAHGKMTIGKEYDINEHNMFYDDQGDRCTKSFYDWSMPDSINIAVSDGSKPNKPIHSRTPNQPDVPSNNATNGGYTPHGLGQVEEHTDDFKTLADLPIVTGETFLREPENSSALDVQKGGDHYKKMGAYQPWEVLAKWMTPDELRGHMKGTVIGYLAREQEKGGALDIAKAAHTMQIYLELTGKNV